MRSVNIENSSIPKIDPAAMPSRKAYVKEQRLLWNGFNNAGPKRIAGVIGASG